MEGRKVENYVPLEVLRHLNKRIINHTKALGKTLNPGEIWETVKPPDSNNLKVVVLFADVSGYTALTETLSNLGNNDTAFEGTDLLAKNLNLYMGTLVKKLGKNGADVIKFAGDALVAIFKLRLTESEAIEYDEKDIPAQIMEERSGHKLGQGRKLIKVGSMSKLTHKAKNGANKRVMLSQIPSNLASGHETDDEEEEDLSLSLKQKVEDYCEYVTSKALEMQEDQTIGKQKVLTGMSMDILENNLHEMERKLKIQEEERQRPIERFSRQKKKKALQKAEPDDKPVGYDLLKYIVREAKQINDNPKDAHAGNETKTVPPNTRKGAKPHVPVQTEEPHAIYLRVKFGIGVGSINLAHIGGARDKNGGERVEYVAVGDALKQAYDAEGHCNPGDVVLSRKAWKAVRNRVNRVEKKNFFGFNRTKYGPYVKHKMGSGDNNFYRVTLANNAVGYMVPENVKIFLKDRKGGDYRGIVPSSVLYSFIPLSVKPYLETNQLHLEQLVNEIRKVTTIFCNLGLTAEEQAAIQQGHEKAIMRLHSLFKAIQAIVFRMDGQINKFLIDDKGSTLIVCFGLPPLAHEDDGTRAMICARGISGLVPEAKLGISTGMAYCGLIGGDNDRKEYTVIGDCVNVSARLMGKVGTVPIINDGSNKAETGMHVKQKEEKIIIDYETRLSLTRFKSSFFFDKFKKPFDLKGKTALVQAFCFNQSITSIKPMVGGEKRLLCIVENHVENPQKNTRSTPFGKNNQGLTTMPLSFVRSIKSLSYKASVGDLLRLSVKSNGALSSADYQLIWYKTAKIDDVNIGQDVHPDEKLGQLAAEANTESILFFDLKLRTGPDQYIKEEPSEPSKNSRAGAHSQVKLIKDASYKYDLRDLSDMAQFMVKKNPRTNRAVSQHFMTVKEGASALLNASGPPRSRRVADTIYHYKDFLSREFEVDGEPHLGVWYQCEDTMSVIKTLKGVKKKVNTGVQVVVIDGAHGVGKSFAVNHVFNNNNYNLPEDYNYAMNNIRSANAKPGMQSVNLSNNQNKQLVVVNTKCTDQATAAESLFVEISQMVDQIVAYDLRENNSIKGPTQQERSKSLAAAFFRGRKVKSFIVPEGHLAEYEFLGGVFDYEPTERDLDLLEQIKLDDEKKNTWWWANKLAIDRIFARDDMFRAIQEFNVNRRNSVENPSKEPSEADKLLSVLCLVLIGYAEILGPIAVIFEDAQYISPFTQAILLYFCREAHSVNITFVLPCRSLVTNYGSKYLDLRDGVASNADFAKQYGVEEIVMNMISANVSKQFNNDDRKNTVMTRTPTAFPVLEDSRRDSGLAKKLEFSPSGSQSLYNFFDDGDYPIGDMIADSNLLRIRLMQFYRCRLIQVKARREYTASLVKNIMEERFPPNFLIDTLTKKTNGNPLYIKETIMFYQAHKILKLHNPGDGEVADVDSPQIRTRHSRALTRPLEHWYLQNNLLNTKYFKHVPSLVESYCAMVVDHFDVYGQLALKVAALLATFGDKTVDEDVRGCFTFGMILRCHPLMRAQTKEEVEQNLEPEQKIRIKSEWRYIKRSSIIEVQDGHLEGEHGTLYRFGDEWLRMCLLRRLTIPVRENILKKSKELKNNYDNSQQNKVERGRQRRQGGDGGESYASSEINFRSNSLNSTRNTRDGVSEARSNFMPALGRNRSHQKKRFSQIQQWLHERAGNSGVSTSN
eukprot:snap_masked-scaffold_4-processed-gene-2.36-mRNA-1 protein AED:0.43 eAED:0.80 QI:0/-1/0/1/-1/1/1/0/1682